MEIVFFLLKLALEMFVALFVAAPAVIIEKVTDGSSSAIRKVAGGAILAIYSVLLTAFVKYCFTDIHVMGAQSIGDTIGNLVLFFEIVGIMLLFIMGGFTIMRGKEVRSQKVPASFGNQPANALRNKYPMLPARYSFKDVCGMSDLKDRMMKAYQANQVEGKNGILLSGDPGNGKTFIAEAFAGEIGWKFMLISIADIKSKWIGQTTEQLKEVFAVAARGAPLVLFFDECDSMLSSRDGLVGDSSGGGQDMLQTTNAFLNSIVSLRDVKNVIVIAATNYPDSLDAAATREGRFDFKVHIPNPDQEARMGLLRKFGGNARFEGSVFDRLVQRWEGFSTIRMKEIAEGLAKLAAAGKNPISVDDAMGVLRGIQGSSGAILPEGTKSLDQLKFDADVRSRLNALSDRMRNIQEVEDMGGEVPKGVIFWGPPGTGKTAVAKALAKSSGWAFLPTSGNDLIHDHGKIDDLIKKASDLRPCIVFIDEAENALGDRRTNPYGSEIVNKILSVTDGVVPLHDIMFIAATNHPNQLDEAILRGGRFSERVEFRKPEDETVLDLVRNWFDSKRGRTPFAPDFTPEAAAMHLRGKSPSDIQDALQQAVNRAVSEMISDKSRVKGVTMDDLYAVT